MRLYLDEDSSSDLLAKLLRHAGHDVMVCQDWSGEGASDIVQFTQSIRDERVILTKNHHDFEDLHDLVGVAQGRHAGIFVVLIENNKRRDMKEQHIVMAIDRLLAANVPIPNEINVLNHFRG